MAILRTGLIIALVCFSTACGLYDDIPTFDAQRALPDCDAPCGACDMGRWSCAENTCLSGLADVGKDAVCGKDVIFVASGGSGQGTKDAPYPTLAQALTVAGERKAKAIVIAGSPTLEGPVELIDGVNIYGGYDPSTWTPSKARPKIITTNASAGKALIGVLALRLDRPVSMSRIEIQAKDHTTGPTIGVLAQNTKTLTLRDVVVIAGAAGDGKPGEAGQKGADGDIGGAGGTGRASVPGTSGVNMSCTAANGGRGGPGAINNNQQTTNAEKGASSPGGAAGADPKLRGASGTTPDQAMPGTNANTWSFVDGNWSTMAATSGQPGLDGIGGGGGGGGTAQTNSEGGGGGAGGAGGCGGTGGQPGSNGWPSTGIVLTSTKLVLLNGTVITAGAGGNAGPGGMGGAGGKGARGGQGGRPEGPATDGGSGGNGADGGIGGRGGHGAAGPSYGLFCDEQSTLNQPDMQSTINAGQGGTTPDGPRASTESILCKVTR